MGDFYDNFRKPELFRSKQAEHWRLWTLSTIITLVFNLMLLAYFSGTITERLDDVKNRVNRLEAQVDTVIRGQR